MIAWLGDFLKLEEFGCGVGWLLEGGRHGCYVTRVGWMSTEKWHTSYECFISFVQTERV
jgi:hypothetical protein